MPLPFLHALGPKRSPAGARAPLETWSFVVIIALAAALMLFFSTQFGFWGRVGAAVGTVCIGLFAWLRQRREIGRLRRLAEEGHAHLVLNQALWENRNAAFLATDTQGIICGMSSAAEALLGFSATELVGREKSSRVYVPAEISAMLASLGRDLNGPALDSFEAAQLRAESGSGTAERDWTFVRKDGSRFPVRVSLSAIRNDVGHMVGCVTVFRDITSDREFARAAEAKKTQLEEFFGHAPAAIALLDDELCYLATSKRWIRDYRLPQIDLVGKSHLDIFSTTPRRWRRRPAWRSRRGRAAPRRRGSGRGD